MWRENSQKSRYSSVEAGQMEETAESELGEGNVPGYVLSIKYTLEGILMPSIGSIGLFGKYSKILLYIE